MTILKDEQGPDKIGVGAQSVEDIQRIVREAQTPPAGPAGWDNDEYIDDAMDQERYDSSSYDEWGAPSM